MKKITSIICSLILIAIFSIGTLAQNYSKLSDYPEHIKKTKPFKRFEWYFQQRAYPYDTVPFYHANKVYTSELKKIAKQEYKSTDQISWNPKGPTGVQATGSWSNWGIVSGRVRAITVHPTDPEILYIGAASGGLWKSEDGGNNWIDIGHDLESLNFGAIAIDPNNPEIIYAGSGESNYLGSSFIYYGRGLFKSIDGGNTWEVDTISFGPYTHFTDIAISPFDSDILLVALSSGSSNLGSSLPNEGIWKSSDAGETWFKTLDISYGCDVKFHPLDTTIVYASIGGEQAGSGFYKSSDSGETWEASNNGIEDPTIISRMLFDISLSDPDIIYAVTFAPDTNNIWWGNFTFAYRSENGGQNWQQISEDIPLGGYYGGWYDQGWYDLCIAVDPSDSNHVFIGNVELHETTDGQNFSPVRPYPGYDIFASIAHVDYHKLVFAPSDPNYLYIGNDGGVYQSTNEGATVESKSNGLETFQFYRIGSHPTDPNIIIGGLQDNGTVRTTDGGNSWTMVMRGDGMECFFDPTNPNRVYASYYNGQIARSVNGGASFTTIEYVDGAWITPFFMHPTDNTIFYAANKDVYSGFPFQPITTNLSPVLINTMAQSRINPDNMILAGRDEKLYGVSTGLDTIPVLISTDGGYNWMNVTGNIPGEARWISRVVTHPNQENTMYVVRNGFSEGNKIYKTNNLGETWTNVSGDLPDIPCNDLFIDPENTNHYYVGTDMGVYFSENEGESWIYAGDGMPVVPVMDFDYVKIENTRYLRVATYGRSIYETTDLVTDIQKDKILSQGSILAKPNPFVTETTIEYKLSQSSNVRLSIFNHLGEKVMDLMDNYQSKGKHHFTLNGSVLPAGVYFCVLKTNKGIQTRKIIKLN